MSKHVILGALVAALLSTTASAQQYCAVGSEKWVAGCEASCTASWEGSDCPRSCSATAPPGYVIMDHRVHVHSVNNGGYDVSSLLPEQTFNYKRRVEEAYNYALNVAAKAGNRSAESKIKQDMNSAIAEAESFNTSHQMVRLNVHASKHGSVIDRKRGWSKVTVEILVKCIVPKDLEQQLMKKYALQ